MACLVLLKCAGGNATQPFDSVHAPDMLDELPKEKFMGFLEQPSPDVSATAANAAAEPTPAPAQEQQQPVASADTSASFTIPPLETIISAPDFTAVAQKALTHKAWAFYSSAATDLVTHSKNKELVRRIMIRPRILRNVTDINMERNILGFKSSAPFFMSPAAMARLAHPDGELAWSRGVANEGIFQVVRTPSHYSIAKFDWLIKVHRSQATHHTPSNPSSTPPPQRTPSSSNSTSTPNARRPSLSSNPPTLLASKPSSSPSTLPFPASVKQTRRLRKLCKFSRPSAVAPALRTRKAVGLEG
jgi:hypothetical protein